MLEGTKWQDDTTFIEEVTGRQVHATEKAIRHHLAGGWVTYM